MASLEDLAVKAATETATETEKVVSATGLTKTQLLIKILEGIGIILVVIMVFIGIKDTYQKAENYFNPPIPMTTLPADTSISSIPPSTVEATVNAALVAAKSDKSITESDAKTLETKIETAVGKIPDASYVIPTAATAAQNAKNVVTEAKVETQIQATAKVQGADEVLKQSLDNGKTMNYYGVTLDKRIAYGVYADIDKAGSAGVFYRNSPITVAVGQKYEGKGVTGRVMFDVIRH